MATLRPITFLSDYGHCDEFAGVCRAVIAKIAPGAAIVDLTHGVERSDVRAGAIALANSLPHCAPGIHLAVVDPGVGTERRAVAVRAAAEDRILVGPDNGLLAPALQRLGGAAQAVDASRSSYRLEPVSATFHGRDLFAPVTAALALGAALKDVGEPIEAGSLIRLNLPRARVEGVRVHAAAIHADRFGNVELNLVHDDLAGGSLQLGERLSVICAAGTHAAAFARTFDDVPEGSLLLYEDSAGALALAVNRGSAASLLGLGRDDPVTLQPA